MKLFNTFAQVIRTQGLWLFLAGLIYSFIEQSLTQLLFTQMSSQTGPGPIVWAIAFVAVLISLLYPVLLIFLITQALQNKSLHEFTYAIKEQMRAVGSIILWGLLLVIPGFIRYFQLQFVTWISLLHPKYSSGEIDAQQVSRNLVKHVWGKMLLALLSFGFIYYGLMTALDPWKSFSENLVAASAISLFETALNILFLCWIWKLFNLALARQEKAT